MELFVLDRNTWNHLTICKGALTPCVKIVIYQITQNFIMGESSFGFLLMGQEWINWNYQYLPILHMSFKRVIIKNEGCRFAFIKV